jgi:MinD-like ATPase involved in chromosome partitioning or flagellar assembly
MSTSTKTVSFYSFKGGTGRSTTLANVAYALAEQGANVGCMDLDLAAPGLHMIFPNIGTAHLNTKTIHDYLGNSGGTVHNIANYIIDVGEKIDGSLSGDLFLIAGDIKPPGTGNPSETMRNALELRESFTEQCDLDYLLLDSRSGLSNHMVPLFDEADQFLAFHRWTHQHKTGTKRLAKWLQKGPVLENMMSVASNVPSSVGADEIERWVTSNLYIYDFSDYHVVNSSKILEDGEKVVKLTDPDARIVDQYESLAEKL